MKYTLLASLFFAASFVSAETTITLSGVHNCCKSCTNGITKAGGSVEGVTVTAEGKMVKVTSKSKVSAKKAVEAIMAAGYFGTSDAAEEQASSSFSTTKPVKKLAEATVSGAHLCCQKCANAMIEAVKAVPGVSEHTIVSKASTFTVKGDFTEADLIAGMNKAGFTGVVK
ncbi:MAG: cation transporter [Verrucomicrobia bacterium]|nr:cation transporter [Verrucomicrobiota bacterium]